VSEPFSKMLDLARRTVDGGTEKEFVGEFHHDPKDVKEWQTSSSQEYNEEFRYANKSPQELRRLLEAETNPEERDVLEWTLLAFQAKGWAESNPDDPKATRAGEPYRGEPRAVARPDSIGVLAKDRKPVEHILVGGQLSLDGLGVNVGKVKDFSGLGMVEGVAGVWVEE